MKVISIQWENFVCFPNKQLFANFQIIFNNNFPKLRTIITAEVNDFASDIKLKLSNRKSFQFVDKCEIYENQFSRKLIVKSKFRRSNKNLLRFIAYFNHNLCIENFFFSLTPFFAESMNLCAEEKRITFRRKTKFYFSFFHCNDFSNS